MKLNHDKAALAQFAAVATTSTASGKFRGLILSEVIAAGTAPAAK